MKKIAILGSTGSIGTQALDIIRKNRDRFSAVVLSCGGNVDLLCEQIDEFRPRAVVAQRQDDALALKKRYPRLEVLWGQEGLAQAASDKESHMVLNALVGIAGLVPTHRAILAGKDVALANKETLVAGGRLIMEAAAARKVRILPVDSEHSAVFQCLASGRPEEVRRIILTASGGPFRGFTREQLEHVSLQQALNHPKWKMGKKITVDSATLMNKGLEVIEARWLFDKSADEIDVVIHPESIIHSMVEYRDRSIIAQLGVPDMRIPISYAFSYPSRLDAVDEDKIDFWTLGSLTFEKPDTQTFTCLGMAYEALRLCGSAPVALNAANEALVEMFLDKKINFIDIQSKIHTILKEHKLQKCSSTEEILQIDKEVRERVKKRWS